jgi:hypothetical protein
MKQLPANFTSINSPFHEAGIPAGRPQRPVRKKTPCKPCKTLHRCCGRRSCAVQKNRAKPCSIVKNLKRKIHKPRPAACSVLVGGLAVCNPSTSGRPKCPPNKKMPAKSCKLLQRTGNKGVTALQSLAKGVAKSCKVLHKAGRSLRLKRFTYRCENSERLSGTLRPTKKQLPPTL